jgi:hypothetical protein
MTNFERMPNDECGATVSHQQPFLGGSIITMIAAGFSLRGSRNLKVATTLLLECLRHSTLDIRHFLSPASRISLSVA